MRTYLRTPALLLLLLAAPAPWQASRAAHEDALSASIVAPAVDPAPDPVLAGLEALNDTLAVVLAKLDTAAARIEARRPR